MAVGTAKELPDSLTCTRKSGIIDDYRATYEVTVDDADGDGVLAALSAAGLPDDGDPFHFCGETDANVSLVSLAPTRINRLQYRITANWKRPTLAEQPIDPDGNPTNDPLHFREEITRGFVTRTRPVERAEYLGGFTNAHGGIAQRARTAAQGGNPIGPIISSAMQVYDPPLTEEVSYPVLRITRSERGYDGGTYDEYIDTINVDEFAIEKPWYLFSESFAPYTVMMNDISAALHFHNGFSYWRVMYELYIDPSGWDVELPDRDVVARAMPGDPNGKGGTWSNDDFVAGMPRNRQLLDPNGVPINRPVLLDGDGQPLENQLDPPVYTKWRIYPVAFFANLNLQDPFVG